MTRAAIDSAQESHSTGIDRNTCVYLLRAAVESEDTERVAALVSLVAMAAKTLDMPAKIEALLVLSRSALHLEAYEDAMHWVTNAIALSEKNRDIAAEAHVIHARLLNRLGLHTEAFSAAHLALRLAKGNPKLTASAWGAIGDAEQLVSPPESVKASFDEMLSHAVAAGDASLQAQAHRGICVAILIDCGRRRSKGYSAAEARDEDNLLEAGNHAAEALRLSTEAGSRVGIQLARYLQAGILNEAGRYAKAQTELEDLISDDDVPFGGYANNILSLFSELLIGSGDYRRAQSMALRAFNASMTVGKRRDALVACKMLSMAYEADKQFQSALEWHKRYHELHVEVGSASARVKAIAISIQEDAERARELARAANQRVDALQQSNELLCSEADSLRKFAHQDSLTGAFNRRLLDQELEAVVNDPHRQHCASVALLDIDHFKQVNDTFSHMVGDKVLRRFAEVVRDSVRECDIVARYGGEEFAVLFRNLNRSAVRLACERIRSRVSAHPWGDLQRGLKVTVSIGVCDLEECDDSVDSVLSLADRRLYAAKQRGRDTVVG